MTEPLQRPDPGPLPAILAGASFIFAVPLILVASHDGYSEDGGFGFLLAEGGWPAQASLALAFLAAIAQAVLLSLGPRPPQLAFATPLLPAAPLLMGALGLSTGMRGALRAIIHVAPADKNTITFAAMGESASCLLIGVASAGVLWLGLAAALAVSSSSRRDSDHRGSLNVAAAAAAALGAWAVAEALRIGALRDAFLSAAHVGPLDRVILVMDAASRLVSLEAAALGVAGLAFVALAVACALAFRRAERRATLAAGLAAAAVFCAVAARGLELRVRQQVEQAVAGTLVLPADPEDEDFPSPPPGRRAAAPLVFNGPTFDRYGSDLRLDADGPDFNWDTKTLQGTAEKVRERSERRVDAEPELPLLFVRLEQGAKTADLVQLVRDAAPLGLAGALLIGLAPVDPRLQLPRSLQVLQGALRVEVGFELLVDDGNADDRNLADAVLTDQGIDLGGQPLPFTEWSAADAAPQQIAALKVPGTPDVPTLLRGIATLHHAGYRTALARAE